MPDSDSLYHGLFAHPRMVEGLVREFVPRKLVAGLDFSRLQRVNPKFHSGRGSARRREGDVIWRLPTREASDIYLYLLIEFQSESDGWMAVRTQVYQGLLWQQVIRDSRRELLVVARAAAQCRKAWRLLHAAPQPYTRERFDDTYNWTVKWNMTVPGATFENTVDNRAWN